MRFSFFTILTFFIFVSIFIVFVLLSKQTSKKEYFICRRSKSNNEIDFLTDLGKYFEKNYPERKTFPLQYVKIKTGQVHIFDLDQITEHKLKKQDISMLMKYSLKELDWFLINKFLKELTGMKMDYPSYYATLSSWNSQIKECPVNDNANSVIFEYDLSGQNSDVEFNEIDKDFIAQYPHPNYSPSYKFLVNDLKTIEKTEIKEDDLSKNTLLDDEKIYEDNVNNNKELYNYNRFYLPLNSSCQNNWVNCQAKNYSSY